jgi:hypothetical protein
MAEKGFNLRPRLIVPQLASNLSSTVVSQVKLDQFHLINPKIQACFSQGTNDRSHDIYSFACLDG